MPQGCAGRPEAASSVAPVSHRYGRSLRPCLGTTIAPLRRTTFHQTLLPLFAHGGVAGAVVELTAALLIVAIALAVWVGGRKDGEEG
ncbi:MAG: hypothetical protein ACJ750_00230 [Gaiellaceae bacterium]